MMDPCPNCEEPEVDCTCDEQDKISAALEHCQGADIRNRKTGEKQHCSCSWVEKRDWEGDPSIPRGINEWKFARCLTCGAEIQKPYPDWLQGQFDRLEEERYV